MISRPRGLAEAIAVLRADPDAVPLGGGTDLLVALRSGQRSAGHVLALRRVEELGGVATGPDRVDLGAGLTWAGMEAHLGATLPALAAAARAVGSPQARNAGTLGGNLGSAAVTGSTLPVLLALDAEVEVAGPGGTRSLPVGDLVRGPGDVALGPGEIVARVRVPRSRGPQQFLKVGQRGSVITAVAQVALVLDLDARRVRCAVGAATPAAFRPRVAERVAEAAIDWGSLTADADLPRRFGALAAADLAPIDDLRASAAYRRHAVGLLAERALARALAA